MRLCPSCHHAVNAETEHGAGPEDVGKGKPKAGDLCVCAYCSAILVYESATTIRRASDTELAALAPDEREALFGALRFTRAFQNFVSDSDG